MVDLLLVADASSPPAPALLPVGLHAMVVYLGERGETPHVWTPQEIDVMRRRGLATWPIWVPAQANPTPAAATAAADAFAGEMAGMGHPKDQPCFVDVEEHAWAADPAGWTGYVAAFKLRVKARGWSRPLAYVPKAAGFDWVAWWTRSRPLALPRGWAGQQYVNDVAAGAYDLSVFDPAAAGVQTGGPSAGDGKGGQLDMFLAIDTSTHKQYVHNDNRTLTYVPDMTPDADNLKGKLGDPVPLDPAYLGQLDGYQA